MRTAVARPTMLSMTAAEISTGYATFGRVLCAVGAADGRAEAVSQALALMAPGGSLTEDASSGQALLERAAAHDLLVLPAHGHARVTGILLGSDASLAVHAAPVAVLIARQLPAVAFPGTVLAATSGPRDAGTVSVAAAIAGAHGRSVVLGHAGLARGTVAAALAQQAEAVASVCGCTPAVLAGPGDAADRMVALAASASAGLVVVGSSGRRGVRALASVSERIAHRAACSVLVLRSSPQG